MRHFDLKNTAILLGCGTATIHRMVKHGIITGKKVGHRRIFTEKELLDAQEYLARRSRQKKNIGGRPSGVGSLCWECLRAYNGCPWSREKKPVPGWKAIPAENYYDNAFIVCDCPLFWKEVFVVDDKGVKHRVNEIPESWKVDPALQAFDKDGRVKRNQDSDIAALMELISEKPYKES